MKRILIFVLLFLNMSSSAFSEIRMSEAADGSKRIFEADFSVGNPLTVTEGSFEVFKQPMPIIGEWDFEDGNTTGLTPYGGGFKVSGGAYEQDSEDAIVSRCMIDGTHGNYSLEFDATAGNGASTIVVFLGMTSDLYYTFEYSYSGAVLRKSDGTDLLKQNCTLDDGESIHFRLNVFGGKLSVYINSSDVAFMESEDALIADGGTGFGTWASPTRFDNIKMVSLNTDGNEYKLFSNDNTRAAAVSDSTADNIRVSSNLKVMSFTGGEAGLILRTSFYFLADGENVYIKRQGEGEAMKTIAFAPHRIKSGEYTLFSARAEGEKLTFSINNTDVISVFDDSVDGGNFGIFKDGAAVYINDLTAESLSSEITRSAEDTEHMAAYELLSALNILSRTDEYGKVLTRAEFAETMCQMLKIPPMNKNVFTDTDSGFAAAAESVGLMSGYGDGTFCADTEIKTIDATCALIRAAGYKIEAEQKGGYPSGYALLAARLGISNGIKSEFLTYSDAAVMIMRTLELDRYDEGVLNRNGETLLHSIFGAKKISGVAESRMTNPKLSEGDLSVENVILENADISFSGRYVVCYYLESSNEAVCIYKTRTDETEISAENLNSASDKFSVRYNDKNVERTKAIAPNAKIIYNGQYLCRANEDGYTKDLLNISDGKITLVTNASSAAEFVFIESYSIFLADRINPTAGEVFNLLTGEMAELGADDVTLVNEDGTTATVSDIKQYDIIKIMRSEEKTKAILVRGNSISGRIKAVDEDTVQIDSDIYKRYKNTENIDNTLVGSDAVVYMDSNYRAIYAEVNMSDNYAFLAKAVYDDSGSEPSLLLWMYSLSSGAMKAYVNDRAVVCDYSSSDSTRKISTLSALNSLIGGYRGLIRYKVDDNGMITSLLLPKNAIENESSGTGVFEHNFYKEDCKHVNNFFYSRYLVTPDTKMLVVPDDTEDLDAYRIKAYGSLAGDEVYTVSIYDCNETLEAGVVVIYKEPNLFEGRVSVVKDICEATNEDGDSLIGIILFNYGAEKTVYAKENLQCDAQGGYNFGTTNMLLTDLKAGDVISYHTDANGYLSNYLVAFENKEQDYYRTAIYGWGTENIPHSSLAIGYARAEKVFQKSFFISMFYGTVNCRPSASSQICVYDSKSAQKLRVGSIEDLHSGDDVLCVWNYSTLNDVIVIKNR